MEDLFTKSSAYPLLLVENEKLKRLLHDLTPGGSEFYNDPEYCAKWIRENREANHYTLAGIVKELKKTTRELIEVGELEDLTFTDEKETERFQSIVKKAKLLAL